MAYGPEGSGCATPAVGQIVVCPYFVKSHTFPRYGQSARYLGELAPLVIILYTIFN